MALHLSVPAIEDKPLMIAEKRPAAVRDLLENLPSGLPESAAQTIIEQLSLLNRQPVGADARLKLMEIYRPGILKTVNQLAALYCSQVLPLSDKARMAAVTARKLLTELAYGYKICILDQSSRVFSLSGNKSLALRIQRAIHALDQLLQLTYYTYVSTPDAIWSEIHSLYLHAAQLGLYDTELDDAGEPSSINLTYKRVLLLAQADPHHLATHDIDRVRDYLRQHAHLAQLRPLGTPENPAGVFLVRLLSDQAPMPLSKFRGEADMRTDILLITIELVRQAYDHLKQCENKTAADILDQPDTPAYGPDLLNYLIKHWALTPKRAFSRLHKTESTNLCVGLDAVHYFLNGETDFAAVQNKDIKVSLNFPESPLDSSFNHRFSSARWLVVNESAGGMALSKFPGVLSRLGIGELLGMRNDNSHQWNLCVVRWANCEESGDLEIGAQMLAPTAKAIAVRPDKGGDYAKALLLPELLPLQQPATVVACSGTYRPARVLQVMAQPDSKPVRIRVTRLLERTPSFERFQFSLL